MFLAASGEPAKKKPEIESTSSLVLLILQHGQSRVTMERAFASYRAQARRTPDHNSYPQLQSLTFNF